VRGDLGDCQRCKLAGGRKTIVFGQGNPAAELMFIGEAPGADEDEQGLAFVGRAGQLLTDIIEKGMRLRRADVFIANVLKCRPPQNRNPEPDEILACQPFLDAQIHAIQPRVIVGLGKFGAPVPAEDGRADHTPARANGRVPGHPGDADLPPRVPAPERLRQEGRLGGHESGTALPGPSDPGRVTPTPEPIRERPSARRRPRT
jgi:uracil-DNA glycosylase family 4